MIRPAVIVAVLAVLSSTARFGELLCAADDDPAAEHWSFRRLTTPAVPRLDPAVVSTPVDAFVVQQLSARGLSLSGEANRFALLRRACLDLWGLPPSPEQIAAFTADTRPEAYERLLDALLASPHFGERFGRHWLDAAGYSDVTGGDNDAATIKLSDGKWKYRDYVVESFNRDRPFDEFLLEQLAGDELVDWRQASSFTPATRQLLIATGFLRNAADDTDEKELNTPDVLHGIWQRTGEVLANNVLGLTMACAKCHDHKFEPISQADYFRLLAVLAPTFNPTAWLPPGKRLLADISPAERAAAERHNADLDKQIAQLKQQQADLRKPIRQRLEEAKFAAIPAPIRADLRAALAADAKARNEVQKYLVDKFQTAVAVGDQEVDAQFSAAERQQFAAWEQSIAALNGTRRAWGVIQAAYDVGPPPVTRLLVRGNHETPGETIAPGFLSALNDGANPVGADPIAAATALGATSGRRLALARWLTNWQSPAGGLVARVQVNRVWQHLFGRGIVETTENLGISGAEPTHPELLEWLASRWVADGRQLKPLLKLLMTSAVYRQQSEQPIAHSADDAEASRWKHATRIDPANRLLWHMPLRRLEAEIVRDAILSAADHLDPALGGPAEKIEVHPDGMVAIPSPADASATKARRSLYVLARRNYHLSMLDVFDQPAMSTNCPRRQQSAVVLQSLTMLNDAFVLEQSRRFAQRVARAASSPAEQVELAFCIALGRAPNPREAAWSAELLDSHRAAPADEAGATPTEPLAHLCQMLLNSNEFLYTP